MCMFEDLPEESESCIPETTAWKVLVRRKGKLELPYLSHNGFRTGEWMKATGVRFGGGFHVFRTRWGARYYGIGVEDRVIVPVKVRGMVFGVGKYGIFHGFRVEEMLVPKEEG